MTIREWLHSRMPKPPAALLWRIEILLGQQLNDDAANASDVCLAAGERIVSTLIAHGSTSRESALDLLTADALVTYGFEAAASDPSTIVARADNAMHRISTLTALENA